MAGRASKSILNAKVNVLFYFLSLFFSFFTRKIFLDCLGDELVDVVVDEVVKVYVVCRILVVCFVGEVGVFHPMIEF